MSNLLSELDAVAGCLDKQRLMLSANEPTAARHWSLQVDSLSSDLFRTHHAEIAAAVRDSQGLDWLETMANKSGGLLLHDGSESGRTGLGLRPGALSRTLREAIDAAMSAREGE